MILQFGQDLVGIAHLSVPFGVIWVAQLLLEDGGPTFKIVHSHGWQVGTECWLQLAKAVSQG